MTRIEEIEATVKDMREGGRTKIAGIDTFAFSPKLLEELLDNDIPYLLAQLREARDEQNAVIAGNLGDYLDAVQRGLRVWIFAEAAHGALLENAQALHETCLAQDEARGKLEAVEKLPTGWHRYYQPTAGDEWWIEQIDRILHPQEAE